MYAHHREVGDPLGTGWCIHSPDVPFFRADDGTFLETPYPLSIVTCAAPEANRLPGRGDDVDLELPLRIERVLAVAAHHGHTHLVLGAWGCGAFGNDPEKVARWFRQSLEGPFAGVFDRVVFAILDHWMDRRNIAPFERELGAMTRDG
jgi:uncharacterized protein (TIGR02452 family)